MLIYVHHAKKDAQENIGLSHLENLAVCWNDGGKEASCEMFSTRFPS